MFYAGGWERARPPSQVLGWTLKRADSDGHTAARAWNGGGWYLKRHSDAQFCWCVASVAVVAVVIVVVAGGENSEKNGEEKDSAFISAKVSSQTISPGFVPIGNLDKLSTSPDKKVDKPTNRVE
ncbi:hypothetical protein PIB30_070708 [Stylosanthes scabra]|uniref:Uncharacterized protein n=1 Tax=Stylosanthes scabra TaxID=79078 RepID=A0ABU6QNZ4_9FABA|nr:hypothetical protein [Stylosanthes scabra]